MGRLPPDAMLLRGKHSSEKVLGKGFSCVVAGLLHRGGRGAEPILDGLTVLG